MVRVPPLECDCNITLPPSRSIVALDRKSPRPRPGPRVDANGLPMRSASRSDASSVIENGDGDGILHLRFPEQKFRYPFGLASAALFNKLIMACSNVLSTRINPRTVFEMRLQRNAGLQKLPMCQDLIQVVINRDLVATDRKAVPPLAPGFAKSILQRANCSARSLASAAMAGFQLRCYSGPRLSSVIVARGVPSSCRVPAASVAMPSNCSSRSCFSRMADSSASWARSALAIRKTK